MDNQHDKKHRFTLTEMLVVVAILAILISMLSPALKKAMESTMNVKCIKNLSQQGMIVMQYADDHQDWIPPTGEGGDFINRVNGGPYGNYGTFSSYIGGYHNGDPISQWGQEGRIKDPIFLCPADESGRKLGDPSKASGYVAVGQIWQCINQRWGKFNPPLNDYSGGQMMLNLTQDISYPNQTPLMGDAITRTDTDLRHSSLSDPGTLAPSWRAGNYVVGDINHGLRLSHYSRSGFNLLYFDGHVDRGSWPDIPEEITRSWMNQH